MKILITIGLDYLRRYLIPRFAAIPGWADFSLLVFDFGESSVDIHLDNNPSNGQQMLELLEAKCVPLASTFTASLVRLIKNTNVRAKLAAIFADAARQLQPAALSTPAQTS